MAKKKATTTAVARKPPPLGAKSITWAMPGEPPIALPRRPRGGLEGPQKLLEWLEAVRAHCLATGAFLTASGAALWTGLEPPEFEKVLELFEKADRKAGLDY